MANLLICCLAFTLAAVSAVDPELAEASKTIDQILASMNDNIDGGIDVMTDDGFVQTEYDLKLTQSQYKQFHGKNPNPGPGNHQAPQAAAQAVNLWPNNDMPYQIDTSVFTRKELDLIQNSFEEISRFTCVKFHKRTSADRNYVFFQSAYNGCYSMLGNIKQGKQLLNLQAPGCRYRGLYIHETLHALGVIHEHQLADRDNYLNIFWSHVRGDSFNSFNKYKLGTYPRHGVDYSYQSIMHYGTTAFTKDGGTTLYPKEESKAKYIGRVFEKTIAYSDVKLLNLMYGCASHCSQDDQNKCGPNGHLDKNCKCICEDGTQDCDKTKTTTTSTCKDAYFIPFDCHTMAQNGKCQEPSHMDWMSKYCAKSCGTCDKYGHIQETCFNMYMNDKKCDDWAATGECQKNEKWMKRVCTKSCNACDDTKRPQECSNLYGNDATCDKWAGDGECKNNPTWMSNNCAKSCKACGEEKTGTCFNRYMDADCAKWAKEGECTANPSWMGTNCAKDCNKCTGTQGTTNVPQKTTPYRERTTASPRRTTNYPQRTTTSKTGTGSCRNLQSDYNCDAWAKAGFCETNPTVKKQCPKACNACPIGTKDKVTSKPTTGTCSNIVDDMSCDSWAKDGHCTSSGVKRDCAKSCNACPTNSKVTVKPTTKPTTGSCSNKQSDYNCDAWAKEGYCAINPTVKTDCQKSCKACRATGQGDCDNIHGNDRECEEWANTGHCEINPSMRTRCAKACNTCPTA